MKSNINNDIIILIIYIINTFTYKLEIQYFLGFCEDC